MRAIGRAAALLVALLWLVLGLATALEAARRYVIDAPAGGLHHDEAITLLAATGHQEDLRRLVPGMALPVASIHALEELDPLRGPLDVARGLVRTDFHPPLYFVAAHLWLQLGAAAGVPAGSHTDPLAVDRWLARLSGGAVLLAVGLFLLEGLRRRDRAGVAGLGAAVLLVANPYVGQQADSCRPYALVILLAAASWILLLRLLGQDDRRDTFRAVLLGLVLGMGILTHYLFAPCAVGMILALLQGRGGPRRAVLAGGVAALVFAPWLAFAGSRVIEPPSHLRRGAGGMATCVERIDDLLRGYFALVEPAGARHPWPPWVLPALLGVACLVLLARGGRVGRALCLVLVLPLGLPLAVDLGLDRRLLSVDRVAVAFVPLASWGAAWLLLVCGRRAGPALLLVAAAALLHAAPPPEDVYPNRYVRGGAKLAAELARDDGARALVVTTADARGQLLQRVRYVPGETDLVLVQAPKLARQVPELARGYSHVFVLGVRHARGHPGFRSRHAVRLDKRMEAAGFRRVASRSWKEDGWALYRRKGPGERGAKPR